MMHYSREGCEEDDEEEYDDEYCEDEDCEYCRQYFMSL